MSTELPTKEPRKSLDYLVKLPPIFKVELLEWDRPRITKIPLYDEDNDVDRLYSLKEVFQHFDDFVERVVKVTAAMKKSKFDKTECAETLEYYYSDDWENPDIYPSQSENYYYALRIPQLRAAELALEALSRPDMWNMDVTAARRKLDAAKLKLWQVLPDFYKAHADPMPQPLGYKSNKPYPHLCSEDDLFAYEDKRLRQHWHAIERQADIDTELPSMMDKRISSLTVTVPRSGDPILASSNGHEVLVDYNTDTTSSHFLDLVEMILAHNDPAIITYLADEPWYDVLCVAATRHELVGLIVIEKYYGHKDSVMLAGTFYRHQVIEELLKLGEIEAVDAPIESIREIPIRVKRLREIM